MTNFIERILRMPRAVITIMALLLLAGGFSYSVLPKESFPAIDVPYLYVSISQTGVSPRDAENLLAKPAEEELNGLDGLVNMTSTPTNGHASVILEFNYYVDVDKTKADTRARVVANKSKLPATTDEHSVNEIDMLGFPILSEAIYVELPERELV